jgi:hypothetical protein
MQATTAVAAKAITPSKLNEKATPFTPPPALKKNQASSDQNPLSQTGAAGTGALSAEKNESPSPQKFGSVGPITTPYYVQPTPEDVHHYRLACISRARDQAFRSEYERYNAVFFQLSQCEDSHAAATRLTHMYQEQLIQISQSFDAQEQSEIDRYWGDVKRQEHQQQLFLQSQAGSSQAMGGYYTNPTHQVPPIHMMGMPASGNAAPTGLQAWHNPKMPVAEYDEHQKKTVASQKKAPQKVAHAAAAAAEDNEDAALSARALSSSSAPPYAKGQIAAQETQESPKIASKAHQKRGSKTANKKGVAQNPTDLPPKTTDLASLTSTAQNMTDAMATMITPTTAHILAQVPANYPDLLQELETALLAPGVALQITPREVRALLVTINEDIVRSFYSQVTDREGYEKSATPSPTTLLTIFYEARNKSQIKGKDHAQKLGITLQKIKEVVTSLRMIRDGQDESDAGQKASETSRLFVAFFNKIGSVGVAGLDIYEQKLKSKVSHTNISDLKAFFIEEAPANEDVFHFYIEQTDKKKLISQTMTPKKLKFRSKVRNSADRLNNPPPEVASTLDLSVLMLQPQSLKNLTQGERKRLAKAEREAKAQSDAPPTHSLATTAADVVTKEPLVSDNEENPNDVSFEADDLCEIRDAMNGLNLEDRS